MATPIVAAAGSSISLTAGMLFRGGRKRKWRLSTIEDVDVPPRLIVYVEAGKNRRLARPGPGRRRALDGDADRRRRGKFDLLDCRNAVPRRLLPVGVPNVGLVHHVVPLALGQRVVVIVRESDIRLKQRARP